MQVLYLNYQVPALSELLISFKEKLSPWCTNVEYPTLRKGTKVYEFKTYHHIIFTSFYNMWYVDGVRTIPKLVFNHFSVIMLAYWAMRAGSSKGNQLR
jgi:hypothetical protein